ncbi:MAG: glycoside hydrolase family 3 N-terminal domain-containing protein, partial [Chloroflexota bacterium]
MTRILILAALMLNLLAPAATEAAPRRQTVTPSDPRVARIVSALTPEERVGQLFVVTFNGPSVDPSSPVYELIATYHIGGVALLAANDNFSDTAAFAGQMLALTRQLQSAAAGIAPGNTLATNTPTPALDQRQFIPLFIAASTSDENYPGNSFLPELSGLTPLPSAMTLGATWSPDRAKSAGDIAGAELSALGINMLFGPTLDVVETPQPSSAADLGARAFGGDPYWVGLLGKAFIEGVHAGSGDRVAVVARHFPGYGASDRALDDQVPTVNKSLAQLTAIDLAPFFAVTKIGSPSSADALLVSHIRYRGFQGNIRDTTRPISFDQQALGVLLGLPEFSAWHENGGLAMSDALGLRGVRRFYDVTGRTFPAFNIARDAFLAGNDVLYLSQFGLDPAVDQPATIKAVLAQFVQKYEEDPAFATRVDQAVSRIIALKMKLYGEFALDSVLPTGGLDSLNAGRAAAFAAARDAATLISPAPADLADRLPAPPTINQQIVFFTDTRLTRQCSACGPRSALAVDALQQAALRLYGPQGSGEAIAANLSSFSFAELVAYLEGSPPVATPVATPQEGTAAATPEEGTPAATPQVGTEAAPPPPNIADATT